MKSLKNHKNISVIGISNAPQLSFTPEITTLIKQSVVFSGGKRHYDLVKDILPKNHQWIYIKGGMDALIETYKNIPNSLVVFASGDPLFYGFANTLQRLYVDAQLKIYPYFNSLQRLCHKTATNYNNLQTVSVHGRSWSALDVALIQQQSLIGVLTDNEKTPTAIAKRMLQYGFDNYSVVVGQELDGNTETIYSGSLENASKTTFGPLNCVLLKRSKFKKRRLGNKDSDFEHLPNRANMITKMPVRLTTLHALDVSENEVFWDVGACTGAVAIEAKQYEPTLQVIAFEKRTICKEIIQKNKERFSTPGIQVEIADFLELNLENYPCPDVVFIGGHGGKLEEIIHQIYYLNPKVRFVTNAVQQSTTDVFTNTLINKGYSLETIALQVNEHNKIQIHVAVNTK